MIGVFAQTDVAGDEQLRNGALHRADRLLHDPLLVVRFRAGGVFRGRNAEQDDAAEPQRRRALGLLHQDIDGQLGDTGHRLDRAPQAFTVRDKQGPDQLRRNDVRFLHQTAQRRRAAQPAHATNRELG